MKRLGRAFRILRLRGIGYVWYVTREVVLKKTVYRTMYESRLYERRRTVFGLVLISLVLVAITLGVAFNWMVGASLVAGTTAVAGGGWVIAMGRRSRAIAHLAGSLENRRQTPVASCSEWPADQKTRQSIADLARSADPGAVGLGWFDNDGRLCSVHRSLPDLSIVSDEEAVQRYRYDLDLIAAGDAILVEKGFRGDRGAFTRESLSLGTLDSQANTPRLHAVFRRRTTIRKSFVPGRTVRDHLVAAGARILSIETENDPELLNLSSAERIEAVWMRGRQVMSEALPPTFLRALEHQLDLIHRAGITGFSLTFGNVVIHEGSGEPWFIDFDSARTHRSTETLGFRRDRDRDRELFNRIYGTDIMTERGAREVLRSLPSGYAPLDLGGGLVTRGFWSVDSGTGRWEYFNGKALEGLIEGKRILDLGSNNGVMPLMMLRSGARSVVGVEQMPNLVESCRVLHRVFEWHEMTSYSFEIHQGDMSQIVDGGWGSFDLVTSFCSLYYLEIPEMAKVAETVRGIAEHFVVQVKTDTRRSAAEEKALKSSVQFVGDLLKSAGYDSVKTIGESSGYARPILIAKR